MSDATPPPDTSFLENDPDARKPSRQWLGFFRNLYRAFDVMERLELLQPASITGAQLTTLLGVEAWVLSKPYAVNDIVYDDGLLYISLTDGNKGNKPSAAESRWQVTSLIQMTRNIANGAWGRDV